MTAVGWMLSLCLMSFAPAQPKWHNETISRSHIWKVDFQQILEQIPEEEIHSTPPGSEYVPSPSPVSSPTTESRKYALRSRDRYVPDEDLIAHLLTSLIPIVTTVEMTQLLVACVTLGSEA
ncbi:hypothetical protein V1527DRAFT_330614 [Lipomyces starkeyi]